MKTIIAFWKGIAEWRSDFSTRYDDLLLSEAYDRGRDLMHRLTLRKHDNFA